MPESVRGKFPFWARQRSHYAAWSCRGFSAALKVISLDLRCNAAPLGYNNAMYRASSVYLVCAGVIVASFNCDGWSPSRAAGSLAFREFAEFASTAETAGSEAPSIEQASQGRGDLSRESQGRRIVTSRAKSVGRIFQLARAGLRRSQPRELPDVLWLRTAGASLPALHVRLQI